jgi:microsomal dipeptidase-like Zn-dependent dipeptidase
LARSRRHLIRLRRRRRVAGWNDASETFNVALELVRRRYTEEQIAKLWSGNLLRVMEQVEKVARNLQSSTPTGGVDP